MGKIFYIMGKSASGKDHIYARLAAHEELGLKKLVLYTTRPIRAEEEDGKQYYFVDDKTACELENSDKIIEMRKYQTVYGEWKYFTADDGQIVLGEGKRYIVIGTLEAYNKFVQYFGKECMLPIYIEVDDGIRLQRAIKREQKQEVPHYEEMCRRFLADSVDFSEENIKNAGIDKRFYNNGAIEECISQIKEEIKTRLC